MGRLVSVFTKKRIEELRKALIEYTDRTDIPILAEFCYKNEVDRRRLYEFPELADTMTRLISKKEAQLERLALENKINVRLACFSLKQLGWKETYDEQPVAPGKRLVIITQPAEN
jgi:hypothetical protein